MDDRQFLLEGAYMMEVFAERDPDAWGWARFPHVADEWIADSPDCYTMSLRLSSWLEDGGCNTQIILLRNNPADTELQDDITPHYIVAVQDREGVWYGADPTARQFYDLKRRDKQPFFGPLTDETRDYPPPPFWELGVTNLTDWDGTNHPFLGTMAIRGHERCGTCNCDYEKENALPWNQSCTYCSFHFGDGTECIPDCPDCALAQAAKETAHGLVCGTCMGAAVRLTVNDWAVCLTCGAGGTTGEFTRCTEPCDECEAEQVTDPQVIAELAAAREKRDLEYAASLLPIHSPTPTKLGIFVGRQIEVTIPGSAQSVIGELTQVSRTHATVSRPGAVPQIYRIRDHHFVFHPLARTGT
ncbi:hypothetical protein ABZ543_13360 [Streptomyces roseifaciens]